MTKRGRSTRLGWVCSRGSRRRGGASAPCKRVHHCSPTDRGWSNVGLGERGIRVLRSRLGHQKEISPSFLTVLRITASQRVVCWLPVAEVVFLLLISPFDRKISRHVVIREPRAHRGQNVRVEFLREVHLLVTSAAPSLSGGKDTKSGDCRVSRWPA